MDTKFCNKCKEAKSSTEFTKGKAVCKKCRNEAKKLNYNTKLCIHCNLTKPKNKYRYKDREVCNECVDELHDFYKNEPTEKCNKTMTIVDRKEFWMRYDDHDEAVKITPILKANGEPHEIMTRYSNYYKYVKSLKNN